MSCCLHLPATTHPHLHEHTTLDCMLQVSIGVTLEQARELQAPYATYCARLEQLGGQSAAALASVQGVQQACEAAHCRLLMDVLSRPQQRTLRGPACRARCFLSVLRPLTRLPTRLLPHPAPTRRGLASRWEACSVAA